MKILALEREVPGITDEQFTAELLQAEARAAWQLYQDGIIREMYFSTPGHEAVLILECESAEQARAALSKLPLAEAGLIDFRVIALTPYDGFARLFR